jgi:hypothetical protein
MVTAKQLVAETPPNPQLRPNSLVQETDKVIKEMGAYSQPDVASDGEGGMVYRFPDLEREKAALEKYRAKISLEDYQLGNTVFDTEKEIQ